MGESSVEIVDHSRDLCWGPLHQRPYLFEEVHCAKPQHLKTPLTAQLLLPCQLGTTAQPAAAAVAGPGWKQ